MRIFGLIKPHHMVMVGSLLTSYVPGVWAQEVGEVADVIDEYCTVRRQTLLDKVSSDLRDTLAHLG
jgi:hypothetical protein